MTASAIVTGVSSGLGLELAVGLAAARRSVVGVSRSLPTDTRWGSRLERGDVLHVPGDVSRPETVDRAFQAAGPGVELVINCAGAGVFRAAGTLTRDDIDETLRANLIGTILFSERAVRAFGPAGGMIVNIMSTAATTAKAGQTLYCASKWGARGYTESLRLELKGTPISVLAVYPGGMATPFWSDPPPGVDPTTFMPPAEVAQMILDATTGKAHGFVSDLVINRR